MPNNQEPMSAAEWKVMRIVWQLQPCAARDVVAEAEAQQGWAPSTVKTLLRRLVEKRQLKATRVGNSFLYRPAARAQDALSSGRHATWPHGRRNRSTTADVHGAAGESFAG